MLLRYLFILFCRGIWYREKKGGDEGASDVNDV